MLEPRTFRVEADVLLHCVLHVDARTPEEAESYAEDQLKDGDDFGEVGDISIEAIGSVPVDQLDNEDLVDSEDYGTTS
jgi:hypothetical protein